MEDGVRPRLRLLSVRSGRARWHRLRERQRLVKPADANRAARSTPDTCSRWMRIPVRSGGDIPWRRLAAGPARAAHRHADTFFGGERARRSTAVNLATGRDRWKPPRFARPVEGGTVPPVFGLVDAVRADRPHHARRSRVRQGLGQDRVGDSRSIPRERPSTAVCGRVLYFQGHPGAKPADEKQGTIYVGGQPVEPSPALPRGRLNALDLDTRAILWSFSRPMQEPNGPSVRDARRRRAVGGLIRRS